MTPEQLVKRIEADMAKLLELLRVRYPKAHCIWVHHYEGRDDWTFWTPEQHYCVGDINNLFTPRYKKHWGTLSTPEEDV